MRYRFLVAVACAVLGSTVLLSADEGMWLFNHPPTDKIRAAYGFTLTQDWLTHVERSSVRFNSGGSGSFVSADGLTFTNHHVAQTCLHQISTGQQDLYKTGFYAKTEADEAKCPDVELNVLQDIREVTAEVNAGVTPADSAAAAGAKLRSNMSRLESACQNSPDIRCQVVTLYSGAVYDLYRYRKYTDVRLVFAPEFQVAFFGGDHDNFEFPRWDLDVAFFRVYDHDRPARLGGDYLHWSTAGVKDGDLAFVSGHPGSTDRLDTMAQLGFLRDVSLPFGMDLLTRRDTLLKRWSEQSPENARRAQEAIFGIENDVKRTRVYLSSLFDKDLMAKKQAEDDGLKAAF